MANSTPSSILNELAKCNKVTAHYQVVKEAGPAHQKVYNVHLHIGGHGPFEGVGSSLKAARNAAASRALIEGAPGLHINPTVELNILSMKSGEIANYRELDSVSLPPRQNEYESLFTSHQTYSSIQQPLHRRPPPRRRLWRMSVTICQRTYIGEGHTKSEARGNAASHALLELKGHLIEKAKIIEIERVQQQQAVLQLNGVDQTTAAIKPPSAVSKVHEIANRNKHAISFETVNENGPAHVKMFYIKCKVGNTEVLGQGVGKKAAKNDAAEKMLVRLKDITPAADQAKDGESGKKSSRSRNSGRPSSQKPRNESGLNPKLDAVTYLTQLMQLRKENAPVYTLKADAGPQQKVQYGRVRYQIQVSIGEFNAVGYGENKKIAKANAASNLLTLIGMNLDELRRKQEEELKNKASPTSHLNQAIDALHKKPLNRAPGSPLGYGTHGNTLTIKQRLEQPEVRQLTCKKKLEYIARTEGFQVLYNDFIKNSSDDKIEYASHLACLTSKPLVFQGSASTVERAREDAARKALESLVNHPLETAQ